MTTWCHNCERWSALPADGGQGDSPRVLCQHCEAPLFADERYRFCADCRRFHRTDYETCPFCTANGVSILATAHAGEMGKYTLEPQKRKAKRGNDYYWQLYMDYKDQTPAPPTIDEPTHLGNGNGNGSNGSSSNGKSNGHFALNGNGHKQNGASNGHASAETTTNSNGTAPGTGAQNGAAHIDLAIAEKVATSLFTDEEVSRVLPDSSPQSAASTSAGNYDEFEYELIQDPSRLAEVAEYLSRETIVGIDTETTGLDPHTVELLLLQISTADKVYIVDCRRVVPLALKPMLENPAIRKIAQNAKFEYEMLRQQAGITLANMYDSMLAERLLTAGISREISLKKIAQKYIGANLDKSVREAFYKLAGNGDSYLADEQLHYAARDAYIMLPIWRAQAPKLKEQKLEQVAELEFQCIAAVGDMELAGVQIDEVRWRKIISDVQVQRDITAAELAALLEPATMQATMFGVSAINLNSNTQLVDALGKLGVDIPDTMEATLSKFNHPAVTKLLEYRGQEKTLSAFGENVLGLINPRTHRIHPDFNQYGADTGRFSCTRPNVQQIPATSDFRKCFVAPAGYKLVTCDYSQAELRILAELSGDEGFVTAFQSGGDLHSLTASQMFGVPLAEVQKPQRNAAKAINFGLAYGMGPGGLAPRLGVTLDESKELISRYFKAYPGVQKWLDKAAKDSVRNGYSATTLGRKRYYNLPDESLKRINEDEWRKQIAAIERQGKNSPIQGCVRGDTHIFDATHGYTTIESLCGRAVSVWDGEQYSNATVVYSGKKQLVKVKLRGGHYIECSPDHKFLVACNNGYKWVWKWKPVTEIKAQNRVALTQPVGEWHLPLDIPPVTEGASWNANASSLTQFTDFRQMGEWLGRLASDGSLADGAVRMLVAEHEEAILPQLELATANLGHVGHSVRADSEHPQRLHRLTVSSRGLVRQLREMGIKERIPLCVWRDSTLLSSYLRGLFDGDGTVHPDGALLTFGRGEKHLAWAREVQEALLLFGIRSRINSYINQNHRINLRVLKRDMPLFCERIGFINPVKQEKASGVVASERWRRISPQYGMAMLVDTITVTDEYVDMYDVVNSDTGRFMANGMVVHNCNADMTKIALIYLRTALKGWDARTVNTVHDEIVVEVREDQAEDVKHLVEDAMVRAGQVILKVVPIVAEASMADYWSK